MILLNRFKVNTNFSEIVKKYIEMINFNFLVCPHCHSSQIIKWGTYDRNVIYFDESMSKLISRVLTIQRVRCKSCGKTHALLPQGIIPYKQITFKVIIDGLLATINGNALKFCEKYGIAEEILRDNYNQFKINHLSRLKVLIPHLNIVEGIKKIGSDIQLQIQYIKINGRCFMQNKLGCLGVQSLLRGTPT